MPLQTPRHEFRLLRPFLPNLTTRLVKSPKVYWTDPGLARILTERPSLGDGALFETFVCGQLLRWCGWQAEPPGLFFFRTQAGREVDFVLAQGRRHPCKPRRRLGALRFPHGPGYVGRFARAGARGQPFQGARSDQATGRLGPRSPEGAA